MNLKEELIKTLNRNELPQIFEKLDERLLNKAQNHVNQWNIIRIQDISDFKEITLKDYYNHLKDELGIDAVSYNGMPDFHIKINVKKLE